MGDLRALAARLEDLIWPRRLNCIFCGDPRRTDRETGLCPDCLTALERSRVPGAACPRCLSLIGKHRPCAFCKKGGLKGIDRAYAPFWYLPVTRALIHSLKFGGSTDALPLLTGRMAASLTDGDFDMMAPVPLHPRREKERGFNQALLLARGVSGLTGIPVEEKALIRRRNTHRQSGLTHDRREGNVRDAFASGAGDLTGKKVLLVDDVRTTGHTAAACASVLRDLGAEKVCLLTACAVARPEEEKRGGRTGSGSKK